jgi:hypothetical protein
MRTRTIAVTVAGLLALVAGFALATPSAADCGGPTITVAPTSGPPGAALTITGTGFGDNCYDTGPPPPGEGVLGNPLQDVEIGFIDAAGVRTVLGVVDADDEYEVTLDATVPAGATPGPASIRADRTGSYSVAFTVSGEVIPATPPFTG